MRVRRVPRGEPLSVARAKVQAGGILRKSLANDWRTPEHVLEAARATFGGPIPFDPFSGPENGTRALRFCAESDDERFERDSPLFGMCVRVPADDNGLAGKRVLGSGLEIKWPLAGCWVNPPYSSALRACLAKVVHEASRGVPCLVLLPVNRTEVAWMQDFVRAADGVCLIRKRLAFISAIDGAAVGGNPFASWVWSFNVDRDVFREAWSPLGLCLGVEEMR